MSRNRVRLEDEVKRKPGRPPGSGNMMTRALREAAAATGALPHELLLQWARGEPMSRKVPPQDGSDPSDMRNWKVQYLAVEVDAMMDAAKAAAPFYAPKLSAMEVLAGLSNADLDELIRRFATEAGISNAAGGEGEAQEDAS